MWTQGLFSNPHKEKGCKSFKVRLEWIQKQKLKVNQSTQNKEKKFSANWK
jgi:hypothetical protein